MKKILNCFYFTLIIFLIRAFFLFFVYSRLVYRFWPTDSVLYAYEFAFFLVCVPFWFFPCVYLLKKKATHIYIFLFVSYLPEMFVLGGLLLFTLLHWNSFISLDVLLFVCLPLMLLIEVSFITSECLLKVASKMYG